MTDNQNSQNPQWQGAGSPASSDETTKINPQLTDINTRSSQSVELPELELMPEKTDTRAPNIDNSVVSTETEPLKTWDQTWDIQGWDIQVWDAQESVLPKVEKISVNDSIAWDMWSQLQGLADPKASAETWEINDDPFDGLNIVFDKPKSWQDIDNQTTSTTSDNVLQGASENSNSVNPDLSAMTDKPTTTYVDPFLNPNAPSKIQSDLEHDTQGQNDSMASQQDLDGMLQSIDSTTTSTTKGSAVVTNTLDNKKKKLLLYGSWVLWLALLAGASYLVFTTMYPTEVSQITENLQGSVSGPTTPPDTNNSQPADIWNSEYIPWQIPKNSGTDTRDDELLPSITTTNPTIPAQEFGQEDELPLGSEPEFNPTPTQNTGTEEDELPSTVTPEVSQSLKTLDEHVEKIKQLLVIAKQKNDTTNIREMAWVLKSIRALKEKISANQFTSFGTEIEPELSKINFNIDKLTAILVQ